MRLGTRLECVESLPGWCKGVRRKKTKICQKIIGVAERLVGSWEGLVGNWEDDAVGNSLRVRRELARMAQGSSPEEDRDLPKDYRGSQKACREINYDRDEITIRGLAKVKSRHRTGVQTMQLGTRLECVGSLPGWRKGVRRKKTEIYQKIVGVAERLFGSWEGLEVDL
ncbi:hypothetical protein BHM03_00035812 [Ensete ventricosum]|nr:hypothetical protein BHM03_00035812 [Ensete ventricosum]